MKNADAFFGDYINNRIYAVNSSSMRLVKTIATEKGPYPVDQAGTFILPSTRKASILPVICMNTLKQEHQISLAHTPRSTAFHKGAKHVLVAGGNKALTSIVDVSNWQVRKVVGKSHEIANTRTPDFGGTLASGHPIWVTESTFLLLDRVCRTVALYDIDGKLLHEINTPTSLHHAFNVDETWYGCCEGNPESHIPPSLFCFKIKSNTLKETGNLWLPEKAKGGHHIDLHPNKECIYFGSAEGNLYIINRSKLKIEKQLKTRPGTGHTGFSKKYNRAFAINHDDQCITAIDSEQHTVIKNIKIVEDDNDTTDRKLIGHTFKVDDREGKYYCLSSAEGTLIKIDIENLSIIEKLKFDPTRDSYTPQGCFVESINNAEAVK